jgi:hypothetical protein
MPACPGAGGQHKNNGRNNYYRVSHFIIFIEVTKIEIFYLPFIIIYITKSCRGQLLNLRCAVCDLQISNQAEFSIQTYE